MLTNEIKKGTKVLSVQLGVPVSGIMMDNKRSGYNPENEYLDANNNTAESDVTNVIDFLSNGFKLKSTFSSLNYATGEYIYAAFAENPFVTSTGIPGMAR